MEDVVMPEREEEASSHRSSCRGNGGRIDGSIRKRLEDAEPSGAQSSGPLKDRADSFVEDASHENAFSMSNDINVDEEQARSERDWSSSLERSDWG